MGWAPTFGVLLVLLALGGLGSSAFHPAGASYAVRVSEGKGGGLRYAVFSFGGATGYAVGPLIAVAIVGFGGLRALAWAMVPMLVLTPFFYASLPPSRSEAARLPPPPREVLRHLAGPLGLVFGVSAVMSYAQRTFLTMEPILVSQAGGSETRGALVLSTYLAFQAAGTVAGGWLADRVDRQRLLMGLCALAFPAHLAAVTLAPGSAPAFVAAAAAGFLAMAVLPGIVVAAQEMLPHGVSFSSGIVMGLAGTVGSLGVLVTGAAADVVGATAATAWTMPVLLLGVALAAHPALRAPTSAGA